VLVGQSELKGVLDRQELRQLAQRVSIWCELNPFSLEETTDYIRHRLAVASAGKGRASFAPDALKIVQRYSGGTPRLINLIADRCLTAGMAASSTTIDANMAKQAVEALELDRLRRQRKAKPKGPAWWISLGALLALALVAVVFWLLKFVKM